MEFVTEREPGNLIGIRLAGRWTHPVVKGLKFGDQRSLEACSDMIIHVRTERDNYKKMVNECAEARLNRGNTRRVYIYICIGAKCR